ncbi:DUF11 domain-containing protein [Myxococcus stipitatus]|nr:DUF11 domain-containing protein [Myxococcus stipitatus]
MLRIAVADDEVQPGQTLAFTHTFTNIFNSPLVASYASYPVSLPLTLTGCVPVEACTQVSGSYRISAAPPDLPLGEARTVTAYFTVSPSVPRGSRIGVVAGFSFRERGGTLRSGPMPGFDLYVPAQADIGVQLRAQAPLLGSNVLYTLAVRNDGPNDAWLTLVKTTLPASVLLVTPSSDDCSFDVGTREVLCGMYELAPGDSRSLSFTAYYGVLALGPLDATATTTQVDPADPNPQNDSSTASCTALTSLLISCP